MLTRPISVATRATCRRCCRARRAPIPRSSPRRARDHRRGARARGDVALRELTKRFDDCVLLETARARTRSSRSALERIDPDLRAALEFAADQILAYHESQREAEAQARAPGRPRPRARRAGRPGRSLRSRRPRGLPVDRAHDRDPGPHRGRARDRALRAPRFRDRQCRPTRRSPPPRSPGVDEVYRVGGAQAIAAMAYGTESIRAGRRDRRPRQPLRRRGQARGPGRRRHRVARRPSRSSR